MIQRLTAEELGRTKWIKATAKEKISVLRDLILRYDAWMQSGGTRQSIAEPLDWEKEEENECVLSFLTWSTSLIQFLSQPTRIWCKGRKSMGIQYCKRTFLDRSPLI